MIPTNKFDQFVGKPVILTLGTIQSPIKSDGTLVEYTQYGALVELNNKAGVLFYPWHSILSIDVTQAYGQLRAVS